MLIPMSHFLCAKNKCSESHVRRARTDKKFGVRGWGATSFWTSRSGPFSSASFACEESCDSGPHLQLQH